MCRLVGGGCLHSNPLTLRSIPPVRRLGDYQHGACRILNGIANRIETTLQTLPSGTPGKPPAIAALEAVKQTLKDETPGILVRQRPPSTSRAKEKSFYVRSTKVFLTSAPLPNAFCGGQVPSVRIPSRLPLWVVVHVRVQCIEGLWDEGCLHSNPNGTPPCDDHKVFQSLGRLRLVPHPVDPLVLGTFYFFC